MSLYLEIHALQTVPPSCINRDGDGKPKTTHFGGARRLRVSSQAWARAIRMYFADHGTEIGVRARIYRVELRKRARDLLKPAGAIGKSASEESAIDAATSKATDAVLEALLTSAKNAGDEGDENAESGTKAKDTKVALAFYSQAQLNVLTNLIVAVANGTMELPTAKTQAKRVVTEAVKKAPSSIDIALFGRMMATSKDLEIQGAAQFAHALGVAPFKMEADYFTAVDDLQGEDESGAAMMDDIAFGSATLYRYANINLDLLAQNLQGDRQTAIDAAMKFAEAFLQSMPTGRIKSFGSRTLPESVRFVVTDQQPVNLAGAFRKPMAGENIDISAKAWRKLRQYADQVQTQYGLTPKLTVDSTLGGGTIPAALTSVRDTLEAWR